MRKSFQILTARHIANLSVRNQPSPEVQAYYPLKKIENLSRIAGLFAQSVYNTKRYLCDLQLSACWNCNVKDKLKDQFFCGACGSLQSAPKDFNYFHLLSLEEKFSVPIEELTRKFRRLQSLIHPDKFSSKNADEQQNSLEWSSLINKAYKTLLAPIERGEYILSLRGLTLPQDNSVLDKEFLMEIMERNEEVEEADEENILDLREKVKQELLEISYELEESFGKGDFEGARLILVKMKYFKSLEKTIKEKAVKLGVIK